MPLCSAPITIKVAQHLLCYETLISAEAVASMTAQVDECLLGLKAEKHLDRERALRKFQELITQPGELGLWVLALTPAITCSSSSTGGSHAHLTAKDGCRHLC